MDIIKANTPIIGSALAKDHLIWTRESESTGFFPIQFLTISITAEIKQKISNYGNNIT